MDWTTYLYLPYESYNCLTLIEKICEDQGYRIQGIEEMSQYHFKHNWGSSVSYEDIDRFITLNQAKLVNLSDIQEFPN